MTLSNDWLELLLQEWASLERCCISNIDNCWHQFDTVLFIISLDFSNNSLHRPGYPAQICKLVRSQFAVIFSDYKGIVVLFKHKILFKLSITFLARETMGSAHSRRLLATSIHILSPLTLSSIAEMVAVSCRTVLAAKKSL